MPSGLLSKITGLKAAAIAAAFILFVGAGSSVLIDARVEKLLQKDTQSTLSAEQNTLADIYNDDGIATLVDTIERLTRQNRDPDAIYWLGEGNGKVLVTNLVQPLNAAALQIGHATIEVPTADGATIEAQILVQKLSGGEILAVGQSSYAQQDLHESLSAAFLATLAAVGIAAFGLSIALDRILRHRIDTIARTTTRIAAGDLSQRVSLSGRKDEFDRLALVLNTMLAKVEAHILTMRSVTDSLSHDMRLPLTRIRAGIEQGALATTEEGRQDALDKALIDADVALGTFNTLLDIARADSGVGRDAFGPVNLSELVEGVVELFEPLAEENAQTLSLVDDTNAMEPVWAQSVLLRQALGNLVHNAIKYAPTGSPICVRLVQTKRGANLSVEDEGPGIPDDQLERALEPFGRLAHEGTIDGIGLGLALAASTARLHGGQLDLGDNDPGLIATLVLVFDKADYATATSQH